MKLVYVPFFSLKDIVPKALTFCWLLCSPFAFTAHAGTVMDVQELSELPAVTKNSSVNTFTNSFAVDSATPAFGAWQNSAPATQKQDKIWQEGISDQELLREKMVTTLKKQDKPKPSVGPEQAAAPTNEAKNKGVTLAGGAIHGDSEVVGSSWTSPGSQEPIIDEDMMHRQHDVVGAYGQMVNEEDFKMSVGPELYIPGEGADVLGRDGADTSELGMSMKFKWGF